MSEHAHSDQSTQGGTAAGGLLAQMIRDVGDTVSREVEQLRTELSDRAAGGAKGAALLAGAGAAGTVSAAAAASLPIIALRRVMPGWAVALVIAGGSGAVAAALARRGLDELADAAPIDADELKDAARDALRPRG